MAASPKSLLGLEPEEPPPQRDDPWETGLGRSQSDPAAALEDSAVPHLVVQLRDDLARSRLREAFWISVVVHLLALIAIYFAPKVFPVPVHVVTSADLSRDREITFLNLPPDSQKVPPPPDSNIISDKNRMAMSRAPIYHPPDRILDSSPARNPGNPAPP